MADSRTQVQRLALTRYRVIYPHRFVIRTSTNIPEIHVETLLEDTVVRSLIFVPFQQNGKIAKGLKSNAYIRINATLQSKSLKIKTRVPGD